MSGFEFGCLDLYFGSLGLYLLMAGLVFWMSGLLFWMSWLVCLLFGLVFWVCGQVAGGSRDGWAGAGGLVGEHRLACPGLCLRATATQKARQNGQDISGRVEPPC